MQTKADIYLSKLKNSNSLHSGIRQSLLVLSLLVVLCVFWGLKLTGITMAGEAFCGMEEHIHGEECPIQTLICTLEETEAHTHTEDCILRELICETEECEPHTHSLDCLSKTLLCTLEEQDGHTHTEDCRTKHLTCTETECPAHLHEPLCYGQVLVCTLPEEAAHAHGDGCYTRTVSCGLEESGEHSHDENCMTSILSCSLPETEGHSHGEGCWQEAITCTLTETQGHTHAEECYTIEEGYSCGLEEREAHTHTAECYLIEEGVTLCGLEETAGHTHTDECWQLGIGFGCGELEADGHIHTSECITEETQFGCGKEATEGHAHGGECYDTLEACPLEEHIHEESCYSDIHADLETSDDWEMTLAGLTRSTSTAENIVMVAKAQLGYRESIRNFQVDANGIRRGINRYGQWYGNPYGDWSAMFASFCLYYAGVEEVPINAGPEAMRLEWETEGLYAPAAEYAPVAGHLLFLDKDLNGAADAVAVITKFEDNIITTIEGDVETAITIADEAVALDLPAEGAEETTPAETTILVDTVAETTYPIEDPAILGYGMVPFAPELMLLPTNAVVIAKTTAYDQSLFTPSNTFVVYTASGSNYYAFDGTGNAVPIFLDSEGNISADVENPDTLLWSFTADGGANSYLIRNVSTGRYMHAYPNNGSGVTTSGAYPSTLISSGSGVKIRSNSEYARLDTGTGTFRMTQNQNYAAVYQFGINSRCTVWLDGTCGGMMSYGGSPDRSYAVNMGDTMILPEEWQSPEKYSYTLLGWYDVTNHEYYAPGDEVTVTGNMVFYPDWAAASYNIGQYNALVSDTVSTNDFITTRIFDYGILFNVLSETVDVDVNASGHSETWTLLESGANLYNGQETLDFIFRDWDRGNEDISYPANFNDQNHYTGNTIHRGIYSAHLRNILFNPGTQVIGKRYLGTGDHLFQLMQDPTNEHYGYYYYNSEYNAASYNQGAGRFYVYDYLERASDSASASSTGKYSDFLPLNSPYRNTNGNTVHTYSYAGANGEYNGTTHYTYDAKYNSGEDTPDNVGANYHFGMSIDINFYLPNTPGTEGGNQDVYGNDMHFQFSGDDDVWVLVDDQLVLDIGGIHGIQSGDINFTTGIVTAGGAQTGTITHLTPGDHKLTILYLERGSSQSNCAIYFNLAPRYSFSIQKEDVLTRDVLNGAQFSVYLDKACTQGAELWVSKASHDRGDAATNVFTVTNGVANMWGMSAGNTYYIKETKPPDDAGYSFAHGIICVTINKKGLASYSVELTEETNPDGSATDVSAGFTVHGFRIDEETQQAYIIATNAPEWVTENTSIQVLKQWNDTKNHSGEYITAYLTITDPDGTVRRIREVQLGAENNWTYTWENMPKYDQNGNPILYGVQEANVPGYMGTVEAVDSGSTGTGAGGVAAAGSFETGGTYLLKTQYGYLAASNNQLRLISSETEAESSDAAQWIATVNSSGTVTLTNKLGQTLYYNSYAFRASSSPGTYKNLNFSNGLLSVTINRGSWRETQYPVNNSNVVNNITYNHILYTTSNSSEALAITLMKLGAGEPEAPVTGDLAYRITNTPLDRETSLTVTKVWDPGYAGTAANYEQNQVTVKLLSNGTDTGRTVTLNLKNNWTDTFWGLPYTDSAGNVIQYTVVESWVTEDWIPYYGEIIVYDGTTPTYTATITNVYRWGTGKLLPSTGSAARMLYMLCGGSMMLTSLLYGVGARRRRERRQGK